MQKIPVRKINTTSQEPVFSESLSIREVGSLLAGKEMVQELHRHDFYYILVLKKASGTHEIDFIPYKISDNAVFFMRPGQVHSLTLDAGSMGYLVEFKTEFFATDDRVANNSNQLLRKAGEISFYQPDSDTFEKIYFLMTSAFQEYTGKQERYMEVIKANLEIFLIELVRQHRKTSPVHVSMYTQERLDEFLTQLEKYISTHKEVSAYAEMLNLSTYQLNAITKATLGKTCSEVINEYIILESRRYLLATSCQVKEIAALLGYEDVSYFIRFFRKQTGLSPELYRQNFK